MSSRIREALEGARDGPGGWTSRNIHALKDLDELEKAQAPSAKLAKELDELTYAVSTEESGSEEWQKDALRVVDRIIPLWAESKAGASRQGPSAEEFRGEIESRLAANADCMRSNLSHYDELSDERAAHKVLGDVLDWIRDRMPAAGETPGPYPMDEETEYAFDAAGVPGDDVKKSIAAQETLAADAALKPSAEEIAVEAEEQSLDIRQTAGMDDGWGAEAPIRADALKDFATWIRSQSKPIEKQSGDGLKTAVAWVCGLFSVTDSDFSSRLPPEFNRALYRLMFVWSRDPEFLERHPSTDEILAKSKPATGGADPVGKAVRAVLTDKRRSKAGATLELSIVATRDCWRQSMEKWRTEQRAINEKDEGSGP